MELIILFAIAIGGVMLLKPKLITNHLYHDFMKIGEWFGIGKDKK